MIRLRNVCKSYDDGKTYAVKDISFDVPEGKTLVLLGSSGSGKSSTLKMINGLIQPSSGTIEVDGRDVSSRDPVELRRSIGYVFQGIGLFPHMTVEENIGISLRLIDVPIPALRQRARELLEAVELSPELFALRYPSELSGGEQQRVGVARALVTKAKYLLMDEPFGALDAVTRDNLQQLLKVVRERLRITVVFVTHDIFEALNLGDLIAVLHKGRLIQIGDGESLIKNPATPFVGQLFRKSIELLRLTGG